MRADAPRQILMSQTSSWGYTSLCGHCFGLQGQSHLGLRDLKGLTSKARCELPFIHSSQVQVTDLGAQILSQLHHCHMGWMGQRDSCTADPKLPKVMLPSGPALTLVKCKYLPNTGRKTHQYWFLHCSSCMFSTLRHSKSQASSNTLWLLKT